MGSKSNFHNIHFGLFCLCNLILIRKLRRNCSSSAVTFDGMKIAKILLHVDVHVKVHFFCNILKIITMCHDNSIDVKIIGVCYLPGQGLSLQFDSSSVCPIHALPDHTGAGLEHVLFLCFCPVLHDLVHVLHDDQDDQPPFTETGRTQNVLVEYLCTLLKHAIQK